METMQIRVVGGSHHAMKEQNDEGHLLAGAPLTLMAEPGNPYDSNAVRVLSDEKQIGYVARDMSAHVSALLKDGRVLKVKVLYPPKGEKPAFLLGTIEVKPINGSDVEESYNSEDDLDVDP